MNKSSLLALGAVVLILGFFAFNSFIYNEKQADEVDAISEENPTNSKEIETPVVDSETEENKIEEAEVAKEEEVIKESEVIEPEPPELLGPPVKSPEVIAQDLSIPWDIVFLPNNEILVTERPGTVVNISSGARIEIDGIKHQGEGGLLGMVLHPDFDQNNYLYLYQTTAGENATENRVVRYVYQNDSLTLDTTIIDNLPGAQYHDGGRMVFGPDEKLYITVGDASDDKAAQNNDNLKGTILRLNDDGSIPADNPLGTAMYSYGHRNPQGLAFDDEGRLWSTEHGRSFPLSGLDEVNLIVKGANYGWPVIEGNETNEVMVTPRAHSGSKTTWAPASAAYYDGSIFFGGLKGESLYEAVLDGNNVTEVKSHFLNQYGRVRTVVIGADDMMYITTSNTDGRGKVQDNDDKIIKIDPRMFR